MFAVAALSASTLASAILEELGLVQVLVAGVARHREVGAVELELEAGRGDRLVFGPHRLDEVGEIGLVARIEMVGLEGGDQARARPRS